MESCPVRGCESCGESCTIVSARSMWEFGSDVWISINVSNTTPFLLSRFSSSHCPGSSVLTKDSEKWMKRLDSSKATTRPTPFGTMLDCLNAVTRHDDVTLKWNQGTWSWRIRILQSTCPTAIRTGFSAPVLLSLLNLFFNFSLSPSACPPTHHPNFNRTWLSLRPGCGAAHPTPF